MTTPRYTKPMGQPVPWLEVKTRIMEDILRTGGRKPYMESLYPAGLPAEWASFLSNVLYGRISPTPAMLTRVGVKRTRVTIYTEEDTQE